MRQHCTDQELLALVHGEPGWVSRVRGEIHINFCGRCRRRLAAMEAAANSWREIALGPFDPPKEKVEAARQQFLARVGADRATRVPTRWSTGLRIALVSAALACGVLAGIGVWTSRERSPVAKAVVGTQAGIPVVKRELAVAAPSVRVIAPPSIAVSGEAIPALTIEDPRETEVNLLWALHESRLCRTGSVEVSGRTVRGVLETREQLAALKALVEQEVRGAVKIEVRTADEVSAQLSATASAHVTTGGSATSAAGRPSGQRMLISWLTARGLADADVTTETIRISNQAVRLANGAWVESWALQRLVERFGPEERRGMKLASRARLYEMLKSHFDALDRILAQERELLLPIAGPGDASPAALGLFADVARLSSALQDAFAGSSAEPSDAVRLTAILQAASGSASRWGSETLPEWSVFAASADASR